MNPIWLPEGLRPLQNQVAGHTFQEDTKAIGMLQDITDASCVLKPLGKPACAERELTFYRTLEKSEDAILQKLRPFVPQFYEHVRLHINQCDMDFLKLENLTYGMKKPCIMDIKIGKRTWDPEATTKKRLEEEQKYVKCKQTLGLCIPGFQVYDSAENGRLLRHGREYGKQLDVKGFKETIKIFFNLHHSNNNNNNHGQTQNRNLVNEVLRQLYDIRNWFSLQHLLHFYASSILIVYDYEAMQGRDMYAHNNNMHNGNVHNMSGDIERNLIMVRMIDFAHVFPADNCTTDTNYCFGLQNLIEILEELISTK